MEEEFIQCLGTKEDLGSSNMNENGHDLIFDIEPEWDQDSSTTMGVGKRDLYYARISNSKNNHFIFEFYVDYNAIDHMYSYEVWKYDKQNNSKTYFSSFDVSLSEFRNCFEYNDESTHCDIISNYMIKNRVLDNH